MPDPEWPYLSSIVQWPSALLGEIVGVTRFCDTPEVADGL